MITRDGYGTPRLHPGLKVQELLDRYRLRTISLSLTHDASRASAVALSEPVETTIPALGRLLYYVVPIRRRVILSNLRRVFAGKVPEAEIRRLAQAHYAHLARLSASNSSSFASMLSADRREAAWVRSGKRRSVYSGTCTRQRCPDPYRPLWETGNWPPSVESATSPSIEGSFTLLRRPLQPSGVGPPGDPSVVAVRRSWRVLPKKGAHRPSA